MHRASLFIGGRWVAAGGPTMTVVDPATEQPVATFSSAAPDDVDAAVAAARSALPGWRRLTLTERIRHLNAIADGIEARLDEFARTIGQEMGAPLKLASTVHTALPVAVLRSHETLAAELDLDSSVGNSRVLREPLGVVAAIAPWNFPLHQIVAKLAPALTAGCTVVVKPSVQAPLAAYLLAEVIEHCQLPPGVFNLVTGSGRDIGEALVSHPGVDVVSFTGSTSAGRHVGRIAADLVRPVVLELGGKSANVILDDADLTKAVKVGVANAFLNAGQACTAWTRMIVPRKSLDDVLTLCRESVAGYRPGPPDDPATRLGPLVSAQQRESVLEHIRNAVADGLRLITGGTDRPDHLDTGYYVRPTVFADVPRGGRLAQEEVFGPVLAVLDYDDEDEALAIANDSAYGLAGAVWSGDQERALRFAGRMETGQIDINGGRFNPLAPFGGYKQSGIGREFGLHGVSEYLHTKSLQL